MIFTILLALFFAALVFIHYLQGLFSSTISAIIAVFAAVLAFSWHEKIAENWLSGNAPNVADSIVLICLFAVIYLVLRIIIDKLVPTGVMLPAAIDKLGGAIMGAVAAVFALGIITIAAEELPIGSNIAGYTKYSAKDTSAETFANGRKLSGSNFDELDSPIAGDFDDKGRVQTFPVVLPGVDEIVVNTVLHLSEGGALSLPGDSLTRVHPDFLKEIYAQNIGIQAGAKHVAVNLPSKPDTVVIEGFFSTTQNVMRGPHPETTTLVQIADPYNPGVRRQPITLPQGLITTTETLDVKDTIVPNKKVQYVGFPADAKKTLLVARITFGPDAADSDFIRISPGSVRLVANRPKDPPATDSQGNKVMVRHDYYPIGTLEPGVDWIKHSDKRFEPVLYIDKPDDYLILKAGVKGVRRGVDMVFAVDNDGCVKLDNGKPAAIDSDVFIEVKRMVRQDVSGLPIANYSQTDPSVIEIGTEKHMSSLPSRQISGMKITADDTPPVVQAAPATSAPAH